MRMLLLTKTRQIVLKPGGSPFARRHAMRFEVFALLGYTRKTQPLNEGWVTIADIQRLPLWRGKSVHHVGTNIGRYIQEIQKQRLRLVEAETQWRGRYRLYILPENIEFDVPIKTIGKYSSARQKYSSNRDKLFRFVQKYVRARSLFHEGWLTHQGHTGGRKGLDEERQQLDAFGEFCGLIRDPSFDPSLRLLANIAALQVADRVGRLGTVTATLKDCERLITKRVDSAVLGRFFLIKCWRDYRAGDYDAAQKSLERAKVQLAQSRDLTLSGFINDREGLNISKRTANSKLRSDRLSQNREYGEALKRLLEGLRERLLAENYDGLQMSCCNIGNTLHRMGEDHYPEAQRWLELSVDICEWMHLGYYDSLSEILLAKIALDLDDFDTCRRRLERGERVARRANNTSNLVLCHVIRALYSDFQNQPKQALDHIVKARRLYLSMSDYDWKTQDAYLKNRFPHFWDEVLIRCTQRSQIRNH